MKKNCIKKIFVLFIVFISFNLIFIASGVTSNKVNNIQAQTQPTFEKTYNATQEIFTQKVNQNPFGLCWDFAACGLVENALAKHYNINIDISEAWISVSTYVNQEEIAEALNYKPFNYQIGSGLNVEVAIYLMENYGFLLEEDFHLFSFNGINSGNALEIYNLYKNDVILLKDMGISFTNTRDTISLNTSTTINEIKSLVKTNGGAALSIYSGNEVYLEQDDKTILHDPNNFTENNHAVRIVGWDDNYKNKGAFIIENSYGDDYRTFYMYYSDFLNNKKSLRVNKATVSALECSINSNSLSYKQTTPNSSTQFINSKNIFYTNQTINIDYSSSLFTSTTPTITYGRKNVNNLFATTYKLSTKSFNLTNLKTLPTGSYVIKFTTTNANSPTFITVLTIISGAEFDLIGGQSKYGSYNHKTYYTYLGSSINFTVNNFNLVSKKPTVTVPDNLTIKTSENITYATQNNYATGSISFTPTLKSGANLNGGEYFTITFETILNTSNTFQVFVNSAFLSSPSVFYDFGDEADFSNSLPGMLYIDKNSNRCYLPQTTSRTKKISGWQVTTSGTADPTVKFDSSNGLFYITNSQIKESSGTYYNGFISTRADGLITKNLNYIILKPTWEDFAYEITYNICKGITINDESLGGIVEKNKPYSFTLTKKEGFEVNNLKVTLNGTELTPTDAQKLEFTTPNITKNSTITITADFFVLAAEKIEFTNCESTTKNYDASPIVLNTSITYPYNTNFTAIFTWLRNGSEFKKVETHEKNSSISITNVADSGTFTCKVQINLDGENSAEVETQTNILIKINKAEVTITLNNLTITYGDEFKLDYTKDKYTLSRGTIYNNEDLLIEIDAGNYLPTTQAGTICTLTYLGAKNTNYNVLITNSSATLTVVKRKLKIAGPTLFSIRNEELVKIDNTKYVIKEGNLVNNDTLDIVLSCDVKKDSPAGDYPITLKLNEQAENYNFITNNYEIEFINGTYTIKHHFMYYVVLIIRIACFVLIGLIFLKILINLKKSRKKFNNSENLGYNYNGRR